jgi:hypothetical protein
LGDPCFGFCRQQPDASFAPPEDHQRELCNRGYARGLCEHFPAAGAPDAVRFSVSDDQDGHLRVVYVFEKDHAPLRHGMLEFPPEEKAPLMEDLLVRQARAFVESYLKARDLSANP